MDKESSVGCDTHTTIDEAITDYFRTLDRDEYIPDRRKVWDNGYMGLRFMTSGPVTSWPRKVQR